MEFSTKKRLNFLLLIHLSAFGSNTFANGLEIQQFAGREADRLQQIQDEQREVLKNKATAPKSEPTRLNVASPIINSMNEQRCFEVDQVKINNANLIKNSTLEGLANNYSDQCLTEKKIAQLMSELTVHYLKKGYATTRVYIPAQDIKGTRVLQLNVDEGVLSKLTSTSGTEKSVSIHTAAPFLLDEPLNLRDLEQALDQFNRLQSNNVTMQIQPGENAGESIVVFDNKPTKRINGYLNFDNKGQDITGREQAALGLGIDNIFGLNDLLSLSYSRSLPYENGKKDSESMSAFYVMPFGYHTASLSASQSSYDTIIDAPFQTLHSKGESESYSLKIDSLLYRGAVNQIRSNIGFTTKENKAYLEDILLGVSSRKLSIAELGLSYSTQNSNHFFNSFVTYQKGLDIFDALEDANDLENDFPKAQFDKVLYGINYFTPFNVLNQKMMFSSSLSGQYAFAPLYGSEQHSIGSLYTVRGFNQKSISGDNGFALKNDLSLLKSHQLANGVLNTKYFIGADYGKVDSKYGTEMTGELSSISAGTTFNFEKVSLDLLITQPLSQPRFLGEKEADFFFSTTFVF